MLNGSFAAASRLRARCLSHRGARVLAHRCVGSATPTDTTKDTSRVVDAPKDIWRRTLPAGLFKESIIADASYNRWLIAPAAVATHLSIGSVYAWSMFNEPLTREMGVVASAASDWALPSVVPIFSTSIVCLGLAAAVAGRWLEDVGPRLCGTLAAACWGGGFLVSAAGIHLHSLPLIYAGYGVLGGIGLGLGYVSPVSTLLRWFPDRKGMATGLAVAGFGGGAMIAAPVVRRLLAYYATPPEYLGTVADVSIQTLPSGQRVVEKAGVLIDVVVANAADLASSGMKGLAEGVYAVGTGSTGAAETFVTLGVAYASAILCGAFAYRVPREGWVPAGWTPPVAPGDGDKQKAAGTPAGPTYTPSVHIDEALRTPQFYLLWTCLFANVSAGLGVLAVAKTMMGDIFGAAMPTIVDGAFCASYVSMISIANMSGRLIWATGSDKIGRKATFAVLFCGGAPLYLSIPYAASLAGTTDGIGPLVLFTGSTMAIFTMYGGGFATIPAYLADVFGTKFVGGIHGRLLTAWSTAGIAGPVGLTYLRRNAQNRHIDELVEKISDSQVRHSCVVLAIARVLCSAGS